MQHCSGLATKTVPMLSSLAHVRPLRNPVHLQRHCRVPRLPEAAPKLDGRRVHRYCAPPTCSYSAVIASFRATRRCGAKLCAAGATPSWQMHGQSSSADLPVTIYSLTTGGTQSGTASADLDMTPSIGMLSLTVLPSSQGCSASSSTSLASDGAAEPATTASPAPLRSVAAPL